MVFLFVETLRNTMETLQRPVVDAAWYLVDKNSFVPPWSGVATLHRAPGKLLNSLSNNPFSIGNPSERLLVPILLWMEYGATTETAPTPPDHLQAVVQRLVQQQLAWYRDRDIGEDGMPCLHYASESLLPDAPYWEDMEVQEGRYSVQEPLHLSLLVWSNECLFRLAGLTRCSTDDLLERHELTVFSMNDLLWDTEYGIFLPRDTYCGDTVLTGSIGGVLPLIADVGDQGQAEDMRAILEANFIEEGHYWVPRVSLATEDDPGTFHKDAVDPVINWLLYYGLMRYDFDDLSIRLRTDMGNLIGEYGFYAHFEHTQSILGNRGIGNGQQPRTAAILVDIMERSLQHPCFFE